MLIEHGADVHSVGRDGYAAINFAAMSDQPDAIEAVLDAGVEVNVHGRAWYGNTPLHSAASAGASASVEFLLARGADAAAMNWRGQTPLDLAQLRVEETEHRKRQLEVIGLLREVMEPSRGPRP